MKSSECLISNMFIEIETLSSRLKNIQITYLRTSNQGLKERLVTENSLILERVKEILSIAELLNKRYRDRISLSNLLLEKCRRTISQIYLKNLFFI